VNQERPTFHLLRLPLSAALIPPLAPASQLAPLIQLMISCFHCVSFHGRLVFLLVLKIINLVVIDTTIVLRHHCLGFLVLFFFFLFFVFTLYFLAILLMRYTHIHLSTDLVFAMGKVFDLFLLFSLWLSPSHLTPHQQLGVLFWSCHPLSCRNSPSYYVTCLLYVIVNICTSFLFIE